MAKDIDILSIVEPEIKKALDTMKDQLIIVLLNRLGGAADIPVEEIDDTEGYIVNMKIIDKTFEFTVSKKH